jgi:FkbM family methyltransferase
MNKQTFLHAILQQFYASIHTIEEDNYDLTLFDPKNVKKFNAERHTQLASHFFDNYDQYYTTFMLLADHASQDLFLRLIVFKLLGHNHVRITDRRWSDQAEAIEQLNEHIEGQSKFDAQMLGRQVQHFAKIPFEGHKLDLDCIELNLLHCVANRQYYFERDGINIKVENGDVVLDVGTCMGDTATIFAALAGETGHVHGFDMLPIHLSMAQHNIDQNGFTDRFTMNGFGVSNKSFGNEIKPSDSDKTVNPSLSLQMDQTLPTITIDDYVAQKGIEKVDYIKMDIEGAELSAIHGAVNTIANYKPKLAISLYHRVDDYITIPQFLKTEFPFYDFYIDHYTVTEIETVLYAVAK